MIAVGRDQLLYRSRAFARSRVAVGTTGNLPGGQDAQPPPYRHVPHFKPKARAARGARACHTDPDHRSRRTRPSGMSGSVVRGVRGEVPDAVSRVGSPVKDRCRRGVITGDDGAGKEGVGRVGDVVGGKSPARGDQDSLEPAPVASTAVGLHAMGCENGWPPADLLNVRPHVKVEGGCAPGTGDDARSSSSGLEPADHSGNAGLSKPTSSPISRSSALSALDDAPGPDPRKREQTHHRGWLR